MRTAASLRGGRRRFRGCKKSETALQKLRLGPKGFRAYIEGVKREEKEKPERPAEKETKMFATLKRAAKALRAPTAEEFELAYIYEAGDRYDLEARERNLSRGALRNRNFGL